jgi:fucose 4-O-acetylase-like acetyltransferase
MDKERIIWIDRMKVIGMYFIIAGHLFPIGYTYIYAFSVPLFFLISGFLYKQEHSNYIFWKKIALNYIVPLFSIRTIMYFW